MTEYLADSVMWSLFGFLAGLAFGELYDYKELRKKRRR